MTVLISVLIVCSLVQGFLADADRDVRRLQSMINLTKGLLATTLEDTAALFASLDNLPLATGTGQTLLSKMEVSLLGWFAWIVQ